MEKEQIPCGGHGDGGWKKSKKWKGVMACCDVSPVAMFILKSMASLIGKYSQTMEYIPKEDFPNLRIFP